MFKALPLFVANNRQALRSPAEHVDELRGILDDAPTGKRQG